MSTGSFTEIIKPGAFRNVLAKRDLDCVCTVNHDESLLLGRTTNGTLKLQEDHRGLNFAVELPDSDYAAHIHENVKRGDLAGASFAFLVGPQDQNWGEAGGKITRSISNISDLKDVSVVSRPAYPGTSVDARQLNQITAETRSMFAQHEQRRLRTVNESFDQAMKLTADFVIDELHVPLQWDSDLKPRSIQDQMKLMRMAVNIFEMRAQGWNVEVVYDERRFPQRIVYAGPTDEERAVVRRRKRFLRDFLLQ
jgi:HK97 family phage prohead protease